MSAPPSAPLRRRVPAPNLRLVRPTENLLARWRQAVGRAQAELRGLSDSQARRRPAPGKWSIKEITGHLVDSAANNHRRFVEAQLQDALVFPGYAQDAWVSVQHYQEAAWPGLADLWAGYNMQLIYGVSVIPAASLDRPRTQHNLDELGWRPVARTQPATLSYMVEDYVGHLEHHLAQIRAIMAGK